MSNTTTQIVEIVGIETGDVQALNAGKSDDGTPIDFFLETQEIEFDNRAHLKKMADNIVVLTDNGMDSSLSCQQDDGDFKPIPVSLRNSVNIGEDINLQGHYFTFRWDGTAKESSPIFRGLYLEKITDEGITNG